MSDSFSVVLRRNYLELIESMAAGIEGKVTRCAAVLVAYYRHWQEWKQKHQRTNWVYQPLRQIHIDLMGLFSTPVIRAANDLLISLGLLERRGNPGNRQDKTYQYNVRFDCVMQLLAETSAVSSFEKIDVSVAVPNFSASHVKTHHRNQFNKVKSSNHDVIEKKETENSQKVVALTTQVEIFTATKELEEVHRLATESLNVDLHSATSLDGNEKIELAQQFVTSLNTVTEQAKHERTLASDKIRRVCIPGLDEEAHEILWKHQATLEKLNADLNAERIKSAIANNPQHLEDAILVFFENSAKGAKTKEAATGFLFNALRHGWKPRQSGSGTSTSVQVYTPSQMLEDQLPPTLEQLVERKRAAWRNASILRPSIEAWVQQTPGVIMTPLGPALADAINAPKEPDLEPNVSEYLEIPAPTDKISLGENVLQPELDLDTPLAMEQSQAILSDKPQQELHQAELVSFHQTPPPETAAIAATIAVEPSRLLTTPPEVQLKQQQPFNRQLRPVEILTSAGEWLTGYFVHSCIAVANLIGTERQYTLFDADGETYNFLGQIRLSLPKSP